MSDRTCFVAMPMRKNGTPEYSHFRAIFNHLRPIVERHGYRVIRADDIQKTGAITKDIVTQLGNADLVIADLSELNPNVFYELGVRHALRGNGTLMILDEKRTPDIPFDLSAYRVIKFVGELEGMDSLTTQLESFLAQLGTDEAARDNPVHDWFPVLPLNVLDSASQSAAAPFRLTIKQLQDRLAKYEKAYGTEIGSDEQQHTPLSAILAAITDAEDGLLPSTMVDDCQKAFDQRDVPAFLRKVRLIVERNVRLIPTAFLQLTQFASVMDLDEVKKALLEQGLQLHPGDANLRRALMSVLAHSPLPVDRERAKKEIHAMLAFEFSDGIVRVKRPDRVERDLGLVGVLLDAYHEDGQHAEALTIAKVMAETFPGRTELLRNYARALEFNGSSREAMSLYRKAIFTSDADDTSAVWLGSELHNRERNRDAAEVYAYACLLDPKDSSDFGHLAQELAVCISETQAPNRRDDKSQVDGLQVDDVLAVVHCAFSCPNVGAEVVERARRALSMLELSMPDWDARLSRAERVECIAKIYQALRTSLTDASCEFDFGAQ